MRTEQIVLFIVIAVLALFGGVDLLDRSRADRLMRDRIVALLGEGPADFNALYDALRAVAPAASRADLRGALDDLEDARVVCARNFAVDDVGGSPDVRYVLSGRSPELAEGDDDGL